MSTPLSRKQERAFENHIMFQQVRTFFDEFCDNPTLWREDMCRTFVRYAVHSPHNFMTEAEKNRLREAGLDENDLEELRIVFKWAKVINKETTRDRWWD